MAEAETSWKTLVGSATRKCLLPSACLTNCLKFFRVPRAEPSAILLGNRYRCATHLRGETVDFVFWEFCGELVNERGQIDGLIPNFKFTKRFWQDISPECLWRSVGQQPSTNNQQRNQLLFVAFLVGGGVGVGGEPLVEGDGEGEEFLLAVEGVDHFDVELGVGEGGVVEVLDVVEEVAGEGGVGRDGGDLKPKSLSSWTIFLSTGWWMVMGMRGSWWPGGLWMGRGGG